MTTPMQLQYLQLAHCDVLSRNNRCRLIKQYGSIDAIVAADRLELIESGITDRQQQQLLKILNRQKPDNELIRRTSAWLDKDRGDRADRGYQEYRSLVCFEDPDYPPLLKEIDCPPMVLFVEGDVTCLGQPQLAIVGSRRSSSNGEQAACWLAGELAKIGFCITSGLAARIDSCAHKGALAGNGRSIGVLGTGIDRIYPWRNQLLASRLRQSGALVSEFFPGTPPIPGNFPQRNRIIAGLSLGVIVVEATVKSGSLITARLAMECNREVFAIPGSIHNGNSRGCHRLIKEGAKLVEDVDSILEELAGPIMGALDNSEVVKDRKQVAAESGIKRDGARAEEKQIGNLPEQTGLDYSERTLLQIMGFDPFPAEVLATRAGVSIEQVSRTLTKLELKGYLQQTTGRYQRLVSESHRDSD